MRLRFASILLLLLSGVLVAPALADPTLYTNGPINGNIGAYSFTGAFGWEMANSFVLGTTSTVTGFSIGAFVLPGDQPSTVTWEIVSGGPDWLGGTVLASGNATFSNQYWGQGLSYYDVYTSTVSGMNVANLNGGTYWLELVNGATLTPGNSIYWDENAGNSLAEQGQRGRDGGPVLSESFTIYGNTGSSTTPEPSSILLFGSVILGVAGVLRLKLF